MWFLIKGYVLKLFIVFNTRLQLHTDYRDENGIDLVI